MPIYEYACENCGKVTQKLISFSQKTEEIECPECKGTAKNIVSTSAFHLKGGGWYSQGYGKTEGSCSAKTDSPKCAGCPAAQG